MHTVAWLWQLCAVGVQVCKSAPILISCYEGLVLISSSSCRPAMRWCDESTFELRAKGMWHLPHQTKTNRQRSLSILYRPDLYPHHLCILLCTQGVRSRGIHGVGIYSKYVFLRLFLLFPWIDISITCKSKKTCWKGGCGVHWNRWSGWQA